MNNSKQFVFDDEKGNNFNITVNHYHMAPQNPMGNLFNIMANTALMMNMMGNSLEDNRQVKSLPRNEILIEDNSNPIQYEIVDDCIRYNLSISNMSSLEDYKILDTKFEDNISVTDFEKNYNDICKNVQHKLCLVSDKTDKFIFKVHISGIGEIVCAYCDNNYFSSLFNKFSNGKRSISFKQTICEKLNIPFKEYLSEVDYIIDNESIYYIRFEAIDGKYHMRKDGI